ncbi:MAG: DUF2267 domain-containing protein [Anaerolineae bacterium]
MDELVKLVAQRVGLSQAQAQQAVETVMGFLKDKLPGGQLDDLLKGVMGGLGDGAAELLNDVKSGNTSELLGDVSNLLGGLLGGDDKKK